MNKKYVMVSLDDAKIRSLAGVLGNKTCKKILDYLVDIEASETEIVRDLKLPANTINYNIKKLVDSGLIEKTKNFFWSVKGRKILKYRVANKKIIISPKSSSVKNILSAFLITGIGALAVRWYYGSKAVNDKVTEKTADFALESGAEIAVASSDNIVQTLGSVGSTNPAIWFLFGALIALIIYMILNWRELQ